MNSGLTKENPANSVWSRFMMNSLSVGVSFGASLVNSLSKLLTSLRLFCKLKITHFIELWTWNGTMQIAYQPDHSDICSQWLPWTNNGTSKDLISIQISSLLLPTDKSISCKGQCQDLMYISMTKTRLSPK